MRDWQVHSLRDLIGSPISGSRPPGGVREDTEGVPSLGGENILVDGGVTYEVLKRIPRQFFRLMPKGHLLAGDVLINKDGAQTGKVGFYDGAFDEASVNEHLFILRSVNGSVVQKLLYYYLLLSETQGAISRRITGSAQPGLNSQFVDAVRLTIPKERIEQERIAEILSTIDEAIEHTDVLIAKAQQIKAGLMHDLFTRGVTPDGQLRPPREKAPKLYKESPLGWIPSNWEVVELSREIGIKHGFAFPGECFFDEPPGDVLLTPGNFHRNGGLYFTPGNSKFFRGDVPPDTILGSGELVTVMTDLSPQTLILGRFAIIETEYPVLHNQRIGLVKLRHSNRWEMRYLVAALNNDRVRREIILGATGTTVRHTSPSRILSIKIARPGLREQAACARYLDSTQSKIDRETASLEKMLSLKRGLMHDLLTGRVRVPVVGAPKVAANV